MRVGPIDLEGGRSDGVDQRVEHVGVVVEEGRQDGAELRAGVDEVHARPHLVRSGVRAAAWRSKPEEGAAMVPVSTDPTPPL